jgi:hypothetical protein
VATRTVPSLSTITRTDTLTVPRIVSRALRETSGITLLMGDGDVFGCFRTSDSVTAGAEVGSVLNTLMPTPLSSTETAPRISSSAPLLKRRRTGARGGPFQIIFTRTTSRGVDDVPDWDLAAATEVACDSSVFATAVCDTEGSAEAGRSAAGSGIAERRRSVPGRQTGETSASRRRRLRSISGNRTNEVYQGSPILDLIRARDQASGRAPRSIPGNRTDQ